MSIAAQTERLDAVIVHFQTDHLTRRLLADLRSTCRDTVQRIVVVDNGSSRPFRTDTPATVVRLPHGHGFAGAVAAARPLVSSPCFLLLNSDLRLPVDPTPRLVDRWRSVRAGVVGPRLVFPDGRFQLSWGDDPSFAGEFLERRRQRGMRKGSGRLLAVREGQSRVARPVDWVSGAAMLIDTDAYDRVGGFDTAFRFGYEDADFCRRLRLAGHPVWYEPGANVVHLLGGTRDDPSSGSSAAVALEHQRGHVRYYDRYRSRPEAALLRSFLLAENATTGLFRRRAP